MTSTSFINRQTPIMAEWLNDVNNITYNRVNGFFNVKEFGAVGNGVVDDRTALQAAFDATKATGGVLVFPAGVYKITGYVGTDQSDASDFSDNVTLHFLPGAQIYFAPSGASGTWYYHALSLEGDNIAITGSGKLYSDRPLTWNGSLIPQRTPYYFGVMMGGKGHRRVTPAVGLERSGCRLEGLEIVDFNNPVSIYAASQVKIVGNKITDFTDTGILIDDCLADIEIAHNTVLRGGDDHIFARHYSTSPWAVAGTYVGSYRIHHNYLENTFAKHIGVGGIADVSIHNNYGKTCWYSGINVEIDNTTWYDNSKRIKIQDNILVDSARAFDPAHPIATYQLAPTDTTQCVGILATTSSAGWPTKRFDTLEINGNLIVNPHWHGVSLSTAFNVAVRNNTMVAGRTTKNAINYDTGGAAIRAENCVSLSIDSGNKFVGNGSQLWTETYEITGDTYTNGVRVGNNIDERFTNSLFVAMSATVKAQVSYEGINLHGTAAWAPGGLLNGTTTTVDITVTGAELGDIVNVTFNRDLQGLTHTAYVRTAGVVRAIFYNNTGGTVSLTSGTLSAICNRKL